MIKFRTDDLIFTWRDVCLQKILVVVDFLSDLNGAQKEAVEYIDGPSLVIAGAGSGKTRVLTYKIAYLLKMGYSPSSILALTFTNKASGEMKHRINSLLGSDISRYLEMGTFHGVFYKILRIESAAIGFTSDFTIYDTADSKNMVKTVLAQMNLNEEFYKPNLIYAQISRCKNNLLTPEKYKTLGQLLIDDEKNRIPKFAEVYDAYCRACRKQNVMDFDDLLLYTNILFRDHPEILEKYMERFRFILVDEYQDTNMSQYIIVKKLSGIHKKLCVVGDDAQSIYGFRGARIENILNFKNDYPDYKLFRLEQNYRSTQTIVNAANSIIKKNVRQIEKKVFSENEAGTLIQVQKAITDTEEGIMVARAVNESVYQSHIPYSEIAILYRTNAQSRNLEEALRKWNIPYKIYGGLSFYQRKEIKDVLAYVRYLINQRDEESLRRIINYPSRKIGNTTVDKIMAVAEQNDISAWEVMTHPNAYPGLGLNAGSLEKIRKFTELINELLQDIENLNAAALLETVMKKSGIRYELSLDKTAQGMSRFENVDELINAARDYEEEVHSETPNEMVSIRSYLENVSLLTDMDNEKEEDRNKLTLMTIHAAKGLEFDHVFVVGVEEGLFPGALSAESEVELEEERRLFYVAITRARKFLTITYTGSRFRFGSLSYPVPSRFISDIDSEFLNWAENNDQKKQLQSAFQHYQKAPAISPPITKARLKPIENARPAASANHAGSDASVLPPEKIVAGLVVMHERFGKGKVISTDDYNNNKVAMVFFENSGLKKILLSFAKLYAAN